MKAIPKIDLMHATQLTREGRIGEAMTAIRSALSGRASAGGVADHPPGMRTRRAPPSLKAIAPPNADTGVETTSPKSNAAPRAQRVSPAHVSRPIRGLFERMGQLGSSLGREGLIGPAVNRTLPIPLPDGARFEARIFANEAGSRAYKLYVPSGYSGQRVPLVVMLHGCTQSPDDFAAGTRMNDVAEEQTFIVAYPAQAQSANPSKCWNWFNAADQQRGQGEPSLIAGITHEIMREFSVDVGRVYVAGLSAGGAAAAVLGSTYPDLYTAIGVHSGLACGAASDMPSAFIAMRQGASPSAGSLHQRSGEGVPTIVFHYDRDPTVNSANGDQVIAQSKAGALLRTSIARGESPGGISYTRTVQADASGRPMLEHWSLHGAVHAWSGGSAAGSYTEPRGPDASREMMRFFLEHQKATASLDQVP